MTREDLFLAVGQVEEARLAGTEGSSDFENQEELHMKPKNAGRMLRNLLIAAVLVSMLAVTAFAATGFRLYDSPSQMIDAIFGDNTGYDHKGVTTWTDPQKPGSLYTNPAYDRVEADPTVVEEDIAPYVSPVGSSISWEGYTLTVDSLLYDSNTDCGILTYTLENPAGVTGYTVENTGEVWGFPVNFNQNSKDYIIQEKTTDTCLAVTSYFHHRETEALTDVEITFSQWLKVTPGPEYQAMIEALFEQIKTEYTPEEAIAAYIAEHGQERYEELVKTETQEQIVQSGYGVILARKLEEMYACPDVISIDLCQQTALRSVPLAEGAGIITPMAFQIDVETLPFLHTDFYGESRIDADNIRTLTIRYKDGTEYPVIGENLNNTAFVLISYPDDNVQTQIFVSPEEDSLGEGYYDVINSRDTSVMTLMFNRLIDIDQVQSVIINGTELTGD